MSLESLRQPSLPAVVTTSALGRLRLPVGEAIVTSFLPPSSVSDCFTSTQPLFAQTSLLQQLGLTQPLPELAPILVVKEDPALQQGNTALKSQLSPAVLADFERLRFVKGTPNIELQNNLLKLLTDPDVGNEVAGMVKTLADENVELSKEVESDALASVSATEQGLVMNLTPASLRNPIKTVKSLRNETFHVKHLSDTARKVNPPKGFPLTSDQFYKMVKELSMINIDVELASSVAQVKEPNKPITFSDFYKAMDVEADGLGAELYFLMGYSDAIENQTGGSHSLPELIKKYVDPNVSEQELARFERFATAVVDDYNKLKAQGIQPYDIFGRPNQGFMDAAKKVNPTKSIERYEAP